MFKRQQCGVSRCVVFITSSGHVLLCTHQFLRGRPMVTIWSEPFLWLADLTCIMAFCMQASVVSSYTCMVAEVIQADSRTHQGCDPYHDLLHKAGILATSQVPATPSGDPSSSFFAGTVNGKVCTVGYDSASEHLSIWRLLAMEGLHQCPSVPEASDSSHKIITLENTIGDYSSCGLHNTICLNHGGPCPS